MVEKSGCALPIEVKSGKTYQRHHALSNILSDESYGIREAWVLSGANVSVVGNIKYLPIYLLMFLKKEEAQPTVYKIDLPDL